MNEKEKRKNSLKYASGVIILMVSVFLAWILPESYGRWKDGRLIGAVQLSGREEIEFFNGNILDALEGWNIFDGTRLNDITVHRDNKVEDLSYQSMPALWSESVRILERYSEAGVLPVEWKEGYASEASLDDIIGRRIDAGNESVPVSILSFSIYDETELYFTVILDTERYVPYYVSASGSGVKNGMAKELGYGNLEEMAKDLLAGEGDLPERKEAEIDFAGALEADSAEVEERKDALEKVALLKFGNEEVILERCVIEHVRPWENDGFVDYGMAVTMGSPVWMALMGANLSEFNEYGVPEYTARNVLEYKSDTMYWKRDILGDDGIYMENF